MQTVLGLHPIINFTTPDHLQSVVASLEKHQQKCIWLKGHNTDITNHINEINNYIDTFDLLIIVESEELISTGIKAYALISKVLENIPDLKQKYHDLKIGGIADNFADCKNVELFGGDFLYMGPIEVFGTESYINLIPQKPDYEWRFIDITIPVIAYGECEANELDLLTQKANLLGFATPANRFSSLNTTQYRFTTD